jgi:hypothetical protein
MRNPMICFRRIETKEGVREIPIKANSVAGEVLGGAFESTLERDLILLQAWDGCIHWFQTQPVKIPYVDATGRARSYVPDLLVSYDSELSKGRPPMLCEVKPREIIRQQCDLLKPKVRAARAYCQHRGWQFRLFDEQRIRTPYLQNVQFLWRYRHSPSHEYNEEQVVDALRHYGKARLCDVIDNYFGTDRERAEAVWTFWVLVAHEHILFDMNQAITRETVFWLPQWRRDARFEPGRRRG